MGHCSLIASGGESPFSDPFQPCAHVQCYVTMSYTSHVTTAGLPTPAARYTVESVIGLGWTGLSS